MYRFTGQKSCTVHRGSGYFIALRLIDRNTLTGQCRFIHRTGSAFYDSIHRNTLTGTYYKQITRLHIFDRYGLFFAIYEQYCRLRCQIHQTFQCIRGASLRACLEHLSDCNQCQDHRCRLEIELMMIGHHLHPVTIQRSLTHSIERIDTITK